MPNMFTATSDQILQFPPMPVPMDRRWKPSVEHAPNCPRCASANTKFCYYNNYSLSQPRYFCKGCRRYWTKGGSLRNVPVGGGCRKNRRGRSSRLSCQTRSSYKDSSSPNGSDSLGQLVSSDGSDQGSDIDLAVVFAKFLNPTTSSSSDQDDQLFASPESELPNEGNASFDQLSNSSMIECQELVYPTRDQESEFVQELPDLTQEMVGDKQQQQEEDQGFMNMNMNMNTLYYNQQLQSLLGDEMVQDALWSSPDHQQQDTNLPWQPMMHLQEFNLPQSITDDADHLKLNSTTDNWSSFDFTSFEVYPRP